jgi:hypothetical protein
MLLAYAINYFYLVLLIMFLLINSHLYQLFKNTNTTIIFTRYI